jgi:alkylated DNA repair dioxygenase AlkB
MKEPLFSSVAAPPGQHGPRHEPAPAAPWPEGFAYREAVMSPDEERVLAERFALLPVTALGFRGLLGWRRVVSCGWRYDGTGRGRPPNDGLPGLLLPLRDRAAEMADVSVQSLQQVLVTEIPPGAALGWRRDRSRLEDVIILSFLTPCTLRLRRTDEHGWEERSLEVMPRSAYLLRGPSRRVWQHSTLPVGELRFMVTFVISP